jgi:hypothetical protein
MPAMRWRRPAGKPRSPHIESNCPSHPGSGAAVPAPMRKTRGAVHARGRLSTGVAGRRSGDGAVHIRIFRRAIRVLSYPEGGKSCVTNRNGGLNPCRRLRRLTDDVAHSADAVLGCFEYREQHREAPWEACAPGNSAGAAVRTIKEYGKETRKEISGCAQVR